MGEQRVATDSSVWVILARWLTGQEAMVVLLFAILGMIGYGGYYAISIAIPAHLLAIQSGYERQDVVHAAAIKAQAEAFQQAITRQGERHEKTMIRIADSFDKTIEQALKSQPPN